MFVAVVLLTLFGKTAHATTYTFHNTTNNAAEVTFHAYGLGAGVCENSPWYKVGPGQDKEYQTGCIVQGILVYPKCPEQGLPGNNCSAHTNGIWYKISVPVGFSESIDLCVRYVSGQPYFSLINSSSACPKVASTTMNNPFLPKSLPPDSRN